jgi:hypothetical protein
MTMSDPIREALEPKEVIARIAKVAAAIGAQAGVGGMETAGSIISYLAKHPEHVAAFMAGETSPVDWSFDWIEQGTLTWHGSDGRLHSPAEARRYRLIRKLEKGA